MAGIKVEWSVEAKSDLIDILGFYIKRNGNAIYSKKLNSQIKRSIAFLVKNPSLGKQTDEASVRALVTANYQIIYEIFDKLILIILIWDCRRSPEDKVIHTRKK
jgi:toxin YoeB